MRFFCMMSLATREDIKNLIADVVALERRIQALEKKIDAPVDATESVPEENPK